VLQLAAISLVAAGNEEWPFKQQLKRMGVLVKVAATAAALAIRMDKQAASVEQPKAALAHLWRKRC